MSLPVITDPQKVLAAVTYFRRGTLQSLLSLQAVDDDGNGASDSQKAKPTINAERFKSALEAIEAGKYTAEQLAANDSLTEAQSKALAL
jgi:hypothetical protein